MRVLHEGYQDIKLLESWYLQGYTGADFKAVEVTLYKDLQMALFKGRQSLIWVAPSYKAYFSKSRGLIVEMLQKVNLRKIIIK